MWVDSRFDCISMLVDGLIQHAEVGLQPSVLSSCAVVSEQTVCASPWSWGSGGELNLTACSPCRLQQHVHTRMFLPKVTEWHPGMQMRWDYLLLRLTSLDC